MTCTNRQLTEPQRQAAFEQLRNAGVQKAIRPFSGPATPENLVDYLNREVYPVLRQARTAVNEIYRQVTDQAPSGNPLFHIFSTNTAATDPGAGFIKLNNATQETATVIRISQSNAILRDITPWLDVMSGSSTAPLGVVTLFKGNDPSRYLRFDLNTMTDQGAYWDLAVGIVESSHDNPFVADDQVVTAFIPGVASTGTTVSVGSLAPIASETFLGNFTAAPAAPAARSGTLVAGGGLTYTAGGTLAVGAGTGLTVNANDVQIATITAESFFGNFTGVVAVPVARTGTSVAGAGLTYTAGGTLAVGAGTRITVNADDVQLAAGAAETFLGNFTAGSAVADYRAGTSVAGSGLTYTAGGTLSVGTGTGIQVNADTVQIAPITAESFFMNNTAGSAVPVAVAGSTVAGGGLTYTTGGILAVGAGTNVTVNANDVAVTNFPLTGLATQAADTFLGNFTAGVATPTARAGTSVAGSGLTYTSGGTLAVGAGTRITVNADDVQLAAGAAESFLMNATAGSAVADYRAGSSVAGNGLTYTAGGTLAVGAGTGITVAADSVAVDQSFSPTWTGVHSFTGASFSVDASTGDVALQALDDILLNASSGVAIIAGSGATGFPVTTVTPGDMLIRTEDGMAIEAGTNGAGTLIVRTNGVERLEIENDGAWQLGGATGTVGTVITTAGASAPPTWGATETVFPGHINVDSAAAYVDILAHTGPSTPSGNHGRFYVHDANVVHPAFINDLGELMFLDGTGIVGLTGASTTLTNSASNISSGTYLMLANGWNVGTTFRAYIEWVFVHTAAATPTLTLELLVGGAVAASHVITPQSIADTYVGRAFMHTRCVTTGAGGTQMATIRVADQSPADGASGSSLHRDVGGNTATTTVALDTTVNANIEARIRMTTAVASNSLTLTQAYIERIFR